MWPEELSSKTTQKEWNGNEKIGIASCASLLPSAVFKSFAKSPEKPFGFRYVLILLFTYYILVFLFPFSFFFFSFSFWFSILCNLNCKPFYYSLAFFSCNISFDFSWGTITMWSHWRLTLFEHYIFMACNIPRHAYLYFQSFLWQIFSFGF